MGCYPPLGKIVSKVLGKCNGRERWREGRLDFDYSLAYPPGPPTEIHYMRPVARTVTFASNNSVYVIPPSPPPPPQPQQQSTPEPQQPQTPPRHEPQQPQTPPRHEPEQHHDTPESQPPQPQTEPPAQTQDAPPQPEPKPPKGPKRGKKKQPGRVRFGPEPPPQRQQEQAQQEHAQGPGNIEKAPDQWPHGASPAPAPTQGQGYLLRYTPSPLPRWEATPRRHEYFSGEYRSYYPTPVREGIYRIATDANRLTTIFSEENPNACTIV